MSKKQPKEEPQFYLTPLNLSIGQFCAQDCMRPGLNGIHVDAQRRRVVSTDRVWMAITPLECEGGDQSFVLPGESVKQIGALLAPERAENKKGVPVRAYIKKVGGKKGKRRIVLAANATTDSPQLNVAEGPGPYPQIDKVMPTDDPTFRIKFDPDRMAKLCRWWSRHAQPGPMVKNVVLDCWITEGRVMFKMSCPDNPTVAFLMGMRLPDA
jgi:hypothetical protein